MMILLWRASWCVPLRIVLACFCSHSVHQAIMSSDESDHMDQDENSDEDEELNDEDMQPSKRSRRGEGAGEDDEAEEGEAEEAEEGEEEEEGEIEDDEDEAADEGFADVPDDLKDLRACKVCRLIKNSNQFEQAGCDNCGDATETSPNFTGMIAMVQPEKSWVAKWQGTVNSRPGLYAIWVEGEDTREEDEDEEY